MEYTPNLSIKISIMWSKLYKILLLLIPAALLIVLFSQKSNLDNYLSKEIRTLNKSEIRNQVDGIVDSLYNYNKNGKSYKITFLEFGAKGCSACKRMEVVMKEIRAEFQNQINVVFLNTLIPDNLLLMKYYGISSIPTQIFLDSSGKEFFRHSGYFSKNEIMVQIDKHKTKVQ